MFEPKIINYMFEPIILIEFDKLMQDLTSYLIISYV